jgi:hypothetical protein
VPELRADGLGVDEFVWMMPEEQAHLYTPSGIEGVAHTWQEDPKAMLRAGGATRLAELAAGTPFRYPKKENSVANQELARRVLQHVDGAEVGRARPQPPRPQPTTHLRLQPTTPAACGARLWGLGGSALSGGAPPPARPEWQPLVPPALPWARAGVARG